MQELGGSAMSIFRIAAAGVLIASSILFAVVPPADGATAYSDAGVALPVLTLPPGDELGPRLMAFNTWVKTDVDAYAAGYVESIDDPDTGAVTLLWNGAQNSLVDAILGEARSIGLTPAVQAWPYSWNQLNTGANLLMSDQTWYDASSFTVGAVSAMDGDYPGLTAQGRFAGGLSANAKSDLESKMASAASALTGVTVRVQDFPDLGATYSGRSDPTAPYRGGSYIATNPLTETCSSGFTIYDNGATHTTTARHCRAAYYARNNSAKQFSGTNLVISSAGGAREMGSEGDASIFDGAWDELNSVPVLSTAYTASLHDVLCSGGGNSGNHCYVEVTDALYVWNDGYGNLNTMIGTLQQGHVTVAGATGDSGGPVWMQDYDPSGAEFAMATGMLQGRPVNATNIAPDCGRVHDAPGDCSRQIVFTNEHSILNGFSGSSLP